MTLIWTVSLAPLLGGCGAPCWSHRALGCSEARLIGEDRGDLAGSSVAGAGDVDGDGFDDMIVASTEHREDEHEHGIAWLVRGPVAGDFDLAQADARLIGGQGAWTGTSVAGAGDVDGDGRDDVLIGALGWVSQEGAAYLLYGSFSGEIDIAGADAAITDSRCTEGLGQAVSGAGDVDGDGYDDLLLGAPESDLGGEDSGAAYIVRGPVEGGIDIGEADARLIGRFPGQEAGFSVSDAGDTDGDGLADVLVGAMDRVLNSSRPADAGFLVRGPVFGDLDLSLADARFFKVADDGEFSILQSLCRVSGAGDTDGDGLDDVILAADFREDGVDRSGAAFVFLGPVAGDHDLGEADARLFEPNGSITSDFSVSEAGDANGDGRGDILVGVPGFGLTGAAYLVLGPVSGSVDLYQAAGRLLGKEDDDSAGSAVASAGDVDGDGFDDALVGAPYASIDQEHDGATHLLLGGIW